MNKIDNKRNDLVSLLVGITVVLSVSGIPSEIFGQSKNFPVFGVAVISLIVGLMYLVTTKKYIVKLGWADAVSFCFIALYLIDFTHLGSLWNVGCLSLLLLFIVLRLQGAVNYTLILVGCICSALLLAGWGYLQYFEYVSSQSEYFLLTGPFHNPAILAAMLALLLGIMINVFIQFYNSLKKHTSKLAWMAGIIIFCLPPLVVSCARAAFIAVLVSVLYGLWMKFVAGRRRQSLYFTGIILAVTLFAGTLYALKPQSAQGRILIWKVGWQMIQDKPLAGFGRGGFAANYLYYQAQYMETTASLEEKRLAGSTHLAFNEPLRITVEYGLIGLLVYLSFVFWILLPSKGITAVSVISKSLFAGVAAWGLFAYPDQTFPVLLLWVMGIGIICRFKSRLSRHSFLISSHLFSRISAAAICVSVIALCGMLHAKWKVYHGLQVYLTTHSFHHISERADVLSEFEDKMDGDVGFAYLYCQVARAEHCDSVFMNTLRQLENSFPTPGLLLLKGDYWKESGCWTEAEAAYKLAANMMPSLQTPRGRLAFLYHEMGRKQEALVIAKGLLTEEVKVYGFDTFILHRDLKRIFEDELK